MDTPQVPGVLDKPQRYGTHVKRCFLLSRHCRSLRAEDYSRRELLEECLHSDGKLRGCMHRARVWVGGELTFYVQFSCEQGAGSDSRGYPRVVY